MEKQAIRGKRRARKLVLQALYQWLMSNEALNEIEVQFRINNNMDKVDTNYFCQILYGVPGHLNELEDSIKPFLDRPIETLNPIELTVLRLGAFELFYSKDIPYRVLLDEAISLTKEFGSQDGYRYVNGVLNNLAKTIREEEVNRG